MLFFQFSFLEKQGKFFSDEKNRKNCYEWRFEVRAKQVPQNRHEYITVFKGFYELEKNFVFFY